MNRLSLSKQARVIAVVLLRKAKNVAKEKQVKFGFGDVWTWTALCADTKLICVTVYGIQLFLRPPDITRYAGSGGWYSWSHLEHTRDRRSS
jgi:hypothetical protein